MNYKAIVSTDLTNGHTGGCSVLHLNGASLNTDVYINGLPVLVAGDIFSDHTNRTCTGHITTIDPLKCSLNVKINGKPVAVDLGSLVCQDILVSTGQQDVFIGDAPI